MSISEGSSGATLRRKALHLHIDRKRRQGLAGIGGRASSSAVIHDDRLHQRQRRAAWVTLVAPSVATLVALGWALVEPVPLSALLAWGVLHLLTMLGVTVGFHRLLAHNSFEARRPAKLALLVLGSMAAQGPVVHWVSNHRRHHQFSDTPEDVHSPIFDHGRRLHGWRGLWHAHVGWMFTADVTNPNRYSRDLLRDADVMSVNRAYAWIVLAGLVLPGLACAFITGSFAALWQGVLWGGFVRVLTVHHATWAVNSVTHRFGSRPWITRDRSTNSWLLSIPSAGESWHNAHHAFPYSARFGLETWQVDLGYLAIVALKWVGQASGIKLPEPARRLSRQRE